MLKEVYKYFRWLSLDIVLGAIIFLSFLESFYNLSLSIHIYFALASAIWLIYTADHLVDSAKVRISQRREFHKKHFKTLIFLGGVVLALAFLNVYFLPYRILQNGAILSSFCIGYLLIVYFVPSLWFKEVLVSVGYASGVFLAPITLKETVNLFDIIFAIHLLVVALINLLVFSYYDKEEDEHSGFASLPIRLGLKKTQLLINVLVASSLVLSFFWMLIYDSLIELELIYVLMTLVLAAIYWKPSYFKIKERYRIAGDAIFYLPVLFLL